VKEVRLFIEGRVEKTIKVKDDDVKKLLKVFELFDVGIKDLVYAKGKVVGKE
jgi:hypothetical protein